MAAVVYFDTSAYANKLRSVGFSDKQAEVQAEALAGIFEDRVATKQDLEAYRVATKQDIEALESEMRRETEILRHETEILRSEMNVKFAEFKAEIIKWGIGISATQGALIVSILKFVH